MPSKNAFLMFFVTQIMTQFDQRNCVIASENIGKTGMGMRCQRGALTN
jgi:hypothetical protein